MRPNTHQKKKILKKPKKLFNRSNRKSSLLNVRHSSEAANRPVFGVFVRTPSVLHKSIYVEEMEERERSAETASE